MHFRLLLNPFLSICIWGLVDVWLWRLFLSICIWGLVDVWLWKLLLFIADMYQWLFILYLNSMDFILDGGFRNKWKWRYIVLDVLGRTQVVKFYWGEHFLLMSVILWLSLAPLFGFFRDCNLKLSTFPYLRRISQLNLTTILRING